MRERTLQECSLQWRGPYKLYLKFFFFNQVVRFRVMVNRDFFEAPFFVDACVVWVFAFTPKAHAGGDVGFE